MPQLEISTFPSQIFWLVVSFLILYIIMAKVIVPRISSVIKNRENEIKNNIHISEQLYRDTEIINDEIEKIKNDTETEAREIINNLRININKKINENNQILKNKLKKKLEKDEKNIFKKKEKVLKEINKIAFNLSQEIIKKISNNKNVKKNKLKQIIKNNLKNIRNESS
tara:strand:+ start:985 stop:1491 length:507 start_codon:yes stop_codon:yes gene_type:complete